MLRGRLASAYLTTLRQMHVRKADVVPFPALLKSGTGRESTKRAMTSALQSQTSMAS